MRMRALLLALATAAFAARADVTGRWQTIDEETGQPKSIVELYEREGKLFGRVIDLLAKPDDTSCEKCKGALKDAPIVGMEIITDLQRDGDAYEGGRILDPATGKVYRARLWLEDENTLNVRGYLGVFFRTQRWQRAE